MGAQYDHVTLWRQVFGGISYISRTFVDPHVVVFTLFGVRNTEKDKLERRYTKICKKFQDNTHGRFIVARY